MTDSQEARNGSRRLDERIDAIKEIIHANDQRYAQRFVDNAIALDAALRAAKEAVVETDRRYEQRFMDQSTAVRAALDAAKEAVTKAETAAEKRFESVNEFRAAMTDQQHTYMPRSESELRHSATEARVSAVEKAMSESKAVSTGASQGISHLWAWIVGVIGIVLAVSSFIQRMMSTP